LSAPSRTGGSIRPWLLIPGQRAPPMKTPVPRSLPAAILAGASLVSAPAAADVVDSQHILRIQFTLSPPLTPTPDLLALNFPRPRLGACQPAPSSTPCSPPPRGSDPCTGAPRPGDPQPSPPSPRSPAPSAWTSPAPGPPPPACGTTTRRGSPTSPPSAPDRSR